MNFKNFIILALLLVLTISSCNNDHAESFITTEVPMMCPDTLAAKDVHVNNFDNTLTRKYIPLNDSLLIAVKSPKSGNFIDVLNIKSGKTISSFFSVGEGPDEMIFCDVFYDGFKIVATDYVRNRFAQFPIDSLINPSFKPSFINFPHDIRITSHPLKIEDSIVIVNPFHYTNTKFGIDQDVPRLLSVAPGQKLSNIMDGVKLYTQNVGQANIIRNPETGDIWVIPLGKSVIEVYDSQLVHRKNIIIPSNVMDDADVSIKSTSTGEMVTYKGYYPLAFTSAIISSDNQLIYLCLVGESIGRKERENDKSVKILVMNWNGELIKSYFSPYYLHSLSVRDSQLYATIEDDDEYRILVRLNDE